MYFDEYKNFPEDFDFDAAREQRLKELFRTIDDATMAIENGNEKMVYMNIGIASKVADEIKSMTTILDNKKVPIVNKR